MAKETYCNSCKYAIENNICSCKTYPTIPSSVLNGDVRVEYIRHKDKELSKELAEKVGTKKSYISRIENGKSDIQVGTLFRIFMGLGRRATLSFG